MTPTAEQKKPKKRSAAELAAFMTKARERFHASADADKDIRKEALADLQYLIGDQWDPLARKIREDQNRPVFTVNRIPQFLQQVTNEQRQNRPAGKVSPVGNGADKPTADVLQGLGRHIEVKSNGEVAYDTAFEYAASCSIGYFGLQTRYVDDQSFNQELAFREIRDPFCVYLDPSALERDRRDGNYGFIRTRISKEEYKRKYPQSELVSLNFELGIGDQASEWQDGEDVFLAEYYYAEIEKRTLQELSQPILIEGESEPRATVRDDEYEELPAGVEILQERPVEERKICCCLINGVEILPDTETEFPAPFVPIVPVYGKEIIVEGKRYLISLTRYLRDPQKILNYIVSTEMETIGLTPRAPWVGPKGSFTDPRWQDANIATYAYLEYEPKAHSDGTPLPPPQRLIAEPPIQALTLARGQAENDLKALAGMYGPSLGDLSQERSGKAIQALQREGDTANFHLIDNLSRGIKLAWEIIIEAAPVVYDTPQIVRIVKPDTTDELVWINKEFRDPTTGELKKHDLTTGRYDVDVQTGPSYSTRRAEAVASMTGLAQAAPGLLPRFADLYVKMMDWPGADGIAERLIPPDIKQLQDMQKGGGIQPAQVAQIIQQNQKLNQVVQKLLEERQTEMVKIQGKAWIASQQQQVDLQKKRMDLEGQILGALIKAGQATDAQQYAAQLEQLTLLWEQMHEFNSQVIDQTHERAMSAQNQPPAAAPPPGAAPAPAAAPAQ